MHSEDISAIVLCGGRGSRMGGVDKGLQNFRGAPLALHAVMRLQQQSVQHIMLNANRNLGAYEGFGLDVWPDVLPDYAGPLAGFLTGLEHCETPLLLTVPCDSPLFPEDLVERLHSALIGANAELAVVKTGTFAQPVFCLMRTEVSESLLRFTQAGGRKIDAWYASLRTVPFDRPEDEAAFANANTLSELAGLAGLGAE
jgi:molybdenum cofactor guanylyltransferase